MAGTKEHHDGRVRKALVESWAAKLSSAESPLLPDTVPVLNMKSHKITLKEIMGGSVTKLMLPGSDNHREEAVFTVVGVLKEYDLPPVKRSEISEHRVKYARQHVTIVGYSSERFSTAISYIQDLTYQIVTSFPEGRAESWLPNAISDDYGSSISSNCRYFTVGRNIPDENRIPFAKYVDPAGVLNRFIKEHVAHCMDNDVSYLELKDDKPVIKDPAGFRAGDVVELGFAIVAYRMIQKDAPEKYVCRLVMRTLTLLDTSLAKAAYIQRSAQAAAPSKQSQRATFANNPVAKRRKMFEEEDSDSDVPETSKRMDDMHITPPKV
ncbi:hypothetical protein B0H11DRAFT_1914865 [Mycena galericulata]|nr:hypothetical protein B0H11DRAFT_1914865 [Mycena galericulata]